MHLNTEIFRKLIDMCKNTLTSTTKRSLKAAMWKKDLSLSAKKKLTLILSLIRLSGWPCEDATAQLSKAKAVSLVLYLITRLKLFKQLFPWSGKKSRSGRLNVSIRTREKQEVEEITSKQISLKLN